MRSPIDDYDRIYTLGNPPEYEPGPERSMRAIAASGYTGWVGQEFIPRNPDKMKSLSDAVRICDV